MRQFGEPKSAPAHRSSDYGPDAPLSGAPQIRQSQSAFKAADYFRQYVLDEQSALVRRQAQLAAHRLIQVIPRDRFSSHASAPDET
jgi:hypothetical protein